MVIMDYICGDDCYCLLLLIFSISIAVMMIRMVVVITSRYIPSEKIGQFF